MLSFEEREERRNQLGASEIYKIFNFDSQACQDLWELKVGLQDYVELDNDAITSGNILEAPCLDFYEKETGRKLIRNERIEYPSIKGLVASFDAREVETTAPVENKAINENTWLKWIAKRSFNAEYEGIKLNIPKSYYIQCQTQMLVSNTEYAILNVNTLTDEEQENPLEVEITDIHAKRIIIKRNEKIIGQIKTRSSYMLHCMKYRKRPRETEYLLENEF